MRTAGLEEVAVLVCAALFRALEYWENQVRRVNSRFKMEPKIFRKAGLEPLVFLLLWYLLSHTCVKLYKQQKNTNTTEIFLLEDQN